MCVFEVHLHNLFMYMILSVYSPFHQPRDVLAEFEAELEVITKEVCVVPEILLYRNKNAKKF